MVVSEDVEMAIVVVDCSVVVVGDTTVTVFVVISVVVYSMENEKIF